MAWTRASGSILTGPPCHCFRLVQDAWRCRLHYTTQTNAQTYIHTYIHWEHIPLTESHHSHRTPASQPSNTITMVLQTSRSDFWDPGDDIVRTFVCCQHPTLNLDSAEGATVTHDANFLLGRDRGLLSHCMRGRCSVTGEIKTTKSIQPNLSNTCMSPS